MKTLYYGGKFITMENSNNSPTAILIDKGFIEEVGTIEDLEKKAGKHVKKVNLSGKCLMPAFIDTHSHLIMNAQIALCVDLSHCISFNDIVEVIKQYIKAKKITIKHGLIGFGYDNNFLKEKTHPNKNVLDMISSNIPIMVIHISGHIACANSSALQLAGITNNTMNPPGGVIGKVPGTQIPNGYLEEAGVTLVQSVLIKKIKINYLNLFKDMQRTYIEHGITTVQDGASSFWNMRILSFLSMFRQLKVDTVAYPIISAGGRKIIHKYKKLNHSYKNRLKIGGYKIILDGSPQGLTAWLSKPYLNGSGEYCGYPWMTDKQVEKYVKLAVDEGQQILAHCNGDAASEQYLNAYEKALRDSNNQKKSYLRPVMIHCQTVRNDQLDRMSKMNMIASVFVGHVWYWGDIHIKNLGEDRGNNISPVYEALKRGVNVNFHQDTPVTKPDMLHSVWCAVNRISRSGNLIGEKQRISVYEALKAVTINAAYEYFEEDSKGSIKNGKKADLIILDRSPLEIPPLEIKNIKIMETIKDGKVIYKYKNN